MTDPGARFTWRDGERQIVFGRGVAEEAVGALGGPGYTLLTTERAAEAAPELVAMAGQLHHVGPGFVDELAGDLLDEEVGLTGDRFVALGGGRIVDVAKALAAANRLGLGAGERQARALAVPTTLSGAEMTVVHRHARGVEQMAPRVRPAVVVNDPALSASQPVPELAASALNALGHAAEGPCTVFANPVATLAANRAARLIGDAFAGAAPDRDALALGALLAGYSIDSEWYGLHHVLSQTLVRVAGAGHGPANAVLLQHTLGALAERFPQRDEELRAALGGEDPVEVTKKICALTGATKLRELGIDKDTLERCAEAAAGRAELDMTPPRADRDELLALYEAAY